MHHLLTSDHWTVEKLVRSFAEGEIAIPEIQRPFVWDASKVRDLMDSLYQGYPIGYLIVWRKNTDPIPHRHPSPMGDISFVMKSKGDRRIRWQIV